MKMATEKTAAKVRAASVGGGAGAGVGVAVGVLIVAMLEGIGLTISPAVNGAIMLLAPIAVGAVGAWWNGYRTPPAIEDKIVSDKTVLE